jgi:hypothetical protein
MVVGCGECCLLGCDVVLSTRSLPTFRRNVLPPINGRIVSWGSKYSACVGPLFYTKTEYFFPKRRQTCTRLEDAIPEDSTFHLVVLFDSFSCFLLYIVSFLHGLHRVVWWVKGKAIPLLSGRGGPEGCERSRLPHFLNNRLTDGGEVVSPRLRPPFTAQEVLISVRGWVDSRAIMLLKDWVNWKIHLIGTRSLDLSACSIEPQPTTPPRAPCMISSVIEVIGGGAVNLCRPATSGVRGITEF